MLSFLVTRGFLSSVMNGTKRKGGLHGQGKHPDKKGEKSEAKVTIQFKLIHKLG